MTKEFLEEQKRKLIKEKKELESELRDFAKKDPHSKYNWKSTYPDYNPDSVSDDRATDEAAEENDYITNLSLEHSLEDKLKDVIISLDKIEHNKDYGICEKCGKPISIERLEAYPEARLCAECEKLKK